MTYFLVLTFIFIYKLIIMKSMKRFLSSGSEKVYKSVTHVIFDLDGTLLDTETVSNYALQTIFKKHGKKHSAELHSQVIGVPDFQIARTSIRELKLPLTIPQFVSEYQEIVMSRLGGCKLMPGAERLVKHLHSKKVPMSIGTSSSQEQVELKSSAHTEFFSLFNHIVTSTDPEVLYSKPHPATFLICASRFREKPKSTECLVIEDSISGVRAAIAAGMQCIMVPDTSTPHNKLPKIATQVQKSLSEIELEDFGLPRLSK